MGIFDKLSNWIQDTAIRTASNQRLVAEAAQRRIGTGGTSAAYSGMLNRAPLTMAAQTLDQWKTAIAMATDPDNPDWQQLSALYYNLMLDNHLRSVIESRILYVQRSAFKVVNDKGEENKELSWLLERPWFEELIYRTLFSKFQGRTLIEMYYLTPEGELAEISEIPQAHFNAITGRVLKNPGDTQGWLYKEGPFANYYIQVGKNMELGMLEKLAPIVLAKKLGLGSWLDHIEKYGVPPLFITTDREDVKRLDELYEAASNFKSNHFMVGRGSEKFEVPNLSGAGVAPFDALMERANNEMSKGVLGGSGIADEKSFVGSAEIQYRLAKDRYESDKLFFKYVFNQLVKPRLISLSSVYAPFANHYLEWDNTESLNQKEIIDAISKLGTIVDIDPDYIAEVTGMRILGLKETVPMPVGGADEKK